MASHCMACHKSKIWKPAVVVDIHDEGKVEVQWDDDKSTDTLQIEQLWPIGMIKL